jgi:hypothetical protein
VIRPEKTEQALWALHRILVHARWMAHEAGHEQLASLLDAAEILPKHLADEGDATEAFRQALADLAQEHPACSSLVEQFDEPELAWW